MFGCQEDIIMVHFNAIKRARWAFISNLILAASTEQYEPLLYVKNECHQSVQRATFALEGHKRKIRIATSPEDLVHLQFHPRGFLG